MAAETALASTSVWGGIKKKEKKKEKKIPENRQYHLHASRGTNLVRLVATLPRSPGPLWALFHGLAPGAAASHGMGRGTHGNSLKDSAGVTSSIGKVFNQTAAD